MASLATAVTTEVRARRGRGIAVVGIGATVTAAVFAIASIPTGRAVPSAVTVALVVAGFVVGVGLGRTGRVTAGAWAVLLGCGAALMVFPVMTASLMSAPFLVSTWCAAGLVLLGRRALPVLAGAAVLLIVLMAMFAPPSSFVQVTFAELLIDGTAVSLLTVGIVVYRIWEGRQELHDAGHRADRAQEALRDAQFVHDDLSVKLAECEQELADMVKDQEQLIASLADTSVRDPRTGLLNARHHKRHWLRAIADSRASGLPIAVIALDLDHFGRINKDYSHQTGDTVLEEFAALVRRLVRPGDLPYRLGQGEEFVILLPHTRLDEAVLVAERVRVSCRKHVWAELSDDHRLTVSAGVTDRHPESDDRWVDVLARADQALAEAKENGRDRVVSLRPESTEA